MEKTHDGERNMALTASISVFSKCKEVQMVKEMCKKGKKLGRRTTNLRCCGRQEREKEQRESLGNQFIWFHKLSATFVNKKAYLLSHCNSLGTG